MHQNRINSYKCCRPKVETQNRVALIYGQTNEVVNCRWPKFLAAFSNIETMSGLYKWKARKVKNYVQDTLWEYEWKAQQISYKKV